jgi:hypothetical protein
MIKSVTTQPWHSSTLSLAPALTARSSSIMGEGLRNDRFLRAFILLINALAGTCSIFRLLASNLSEYSSTLVWNHSLNCLQTCLDLMASAMLRNEQILRVTTSAGTDKMRLLLLLMLEELVFREIVLSIFFNLSKFKAEFGALPPPSQYSSFFF